VVVLSALVDLVQVVELGFDELSALALALLPFLAPHRNTALQARSFTLCIWYSLVL
jgi:hypothetical protein